MFNAGGAAVVQGKSTSYQLRPSSSKKDFSDTSARLRKDSQGRPALSVFIWQDGAAFDWRMNDYMISEFPTPPDPTVGSNGLSQDELIQRMRMGNSTDRGGTASS